MSQTAARLLLRSESVHVLQDPVTFPPISIHVSPLPQDLSSSKDLDWIREKYKTFKIKGSSEISIGCGSTGFDS